MPSGGPFGAQEVKRKSIVALYLQFVHEDMETTSCLDNRNEVGVILEPEIGVAGDVKPGAQVMPAAKI